MWINDWHMANSAYPFGGYKQSGQGRELGAGAFDEYTEQIKGDTADIKNSGGRGGGALTAGAFLKELVDFPWAHLDIAGTAYGKKGNAYTTKGATGVPTRLLVEFLIGRAQ